MPHYYRIRADLNVNSPCYLSFPQMTLSFMFYFITTMSSEVRGSPYHFGKLKEVYLGVFLSLVCYKNRLRKSYSYLLQLAPKLCLLYTRRSLYLSIKHLPISFAYYI